MNSKLIVKGIKYIFLGLSILSLISATYLYLKIGILSNESFTTGAFSLLFFILGAGGLFLENKQKNFDTALKETGKPLKTSFVRIQTDMGYTLDEQYTYIIVSEYEENGQKYEFKSPNIWFDPSPYIKGRTIQVWVGAKNYKKYVMDVSFLPDLKHEYKSN